jgi:ribosomal protein S12 methylthiotransferase accessory factor
MQTTIKKLDRARSIGFSRAEEPVPFVTDEPKIPGYFCFPNELAKTRFDTYQVFGQGFDPNPLLARLKSVGELLERLCLSNPIRKNLVHSTFSRGDFIDPAVFWCYADSNGKRKQFEKNARSAQLSWWPSVDLSTGRQVYVPAQMVFLSDGFEDEFPLRRERTSSGAAFGESQENQALIGGIMENIERDATISSYLQKRNIKRITQFPPKINKIIEYLGRYQLHSFLFDITTDLQVPTAMAITLDYTGIGDAVSVGSRAAFSFEEATLKALLESVQCRCPSRVSRGMGTGFNIPLEGEITTMNKRFDYWSDINRISDLDFWLKTNNTTRFADLSQQRVSLDFVINSLNSKGHQILVSDITFPEIREEGFEVLKVTIPQLHPLYLDENAKALYSEHHGEIKDNLELKPHPIT